LYGILYGGNLSIAHLQIKETKQSCKIPLNEEVFLNALNRMHF
jgi:hypothetical protein